MFYLTITNDNKISASDDCQRQLGALEPQRNASGKHNGRSASTSAQPEREKEGGVGTISPTFFSSIFR